MKRDFSKINYVQLRAIIDDTELCCSVDGENFKRRCVLIFRFYVIIAKQLSDLDGKVLKSVGMCYVTLRGLLI